MSSVGGVVVVVLVYVFSVDRNVVSGCTYLWCVLLLLNGSVVFERRCRRFCLRVYVVVVYV